MPLVHAHTVRVHGCKAFLSGKNGTISNARKWAGAHVRESKIPAQGLHSTCAGMLAMHKEIGSVPRPDWTRTWFVVDALHHQNICKTRRMPQKAYTYKMRSETPFGRRPEIQCYGFVTG